MSFQMPSHQQQVIYKADPNMTQSLRAIRDRLQNICRQHANQFIRIETMDGQVITGRLVHCQGGLLYLAVPNQAGHRAFHSPTDEMILTLVLYELLVISLLYT